MLASIFWSAVLELSPHLRLINWNLAACQLSASWCSRRPRQCPCCAARSPAQPHSPADPRQTAPAHRRRCLASHAPWHGWRRCRPPADWAAPALASSPPHTSWNIINVTHQYEKCQFKKLNRNFVFEFLFLIFLFKNEASNASP